MTLPVYRLPNRAPLAGFVRDCGDELVNLQAAARAALRRGRVRSRERFKTAALDARQARLVAIGH
jgi:hypothetical protein